MAKKQVFSTIAEVADRMSAIIEYSFDGIYITDGQADTILINHAYEEITGLKKSEVMGKNMADLVSQKVISHSGSLRVIQTKTPITLHQQFKTGKEALITSSPIFNKEGELVMIVTNVRDLTEIYSLKEEIQEKEEAIERYRLERAHIQASLTEQDMICVDNASLSSLFLANRVAPMDTTVMLFGETGVGKEVMTHYIYQNSLRAKNSLIEVNCGAIPDNLIESELFGYEPGAFTGASRNGKMGMFELANNGTLFLDEVGELPKSMQVKLLRVLQEQKIRRIGGTKAIDINVRIIAATNRNLKKMVETGDFREDLYYRLTVFPISIPPLRYRRKDITPLSRAFLKKLNKKYNFQKEFTNLSIQLLNEYDWPGNIRELKNIIERAIIVSSGNEIRADDLHIYSQRSSTNPAKESSVSPASVPSKNTPIELPQNLEETMAKTEYQYLVLAYHKYGNVRDAAKAMNMTPSTFVRKRKRYEAHNPTT